MAWRGETKPARRSAPTLARCATRTLANLARRTGYVDPYLAARWPRIVGEELAGLCRPGKISGGRRDRTLEVSATSGAAAVELAQREGDLRARRNAHFGPGAVGRVRVAQTGGAAIGAAGLARFRDG
ncbi:MAG: DciA family protein [Parvularculaceae bacterium]